MSPTITVKGYDANNNYLGVLDVGNLNIITTNLDLPDEPQPDEFTAASSDYSWITYRTPGPIDYGNGAGKAYFRYLQVKWKADADETDFISITTSSRGRHYVWIPEVATTYDDYDAIGSNSGANPNSSVYSNRRYLSENGMDLLFPFGIYKPMNHEPINAIYANAQGVDFAGNLTRRDGDISSYVNNIIPVVNHNGTTGSNPASSQYITVSRVTSPPDFYDAEYSMTFDGFDVDLWQFSTTMVPGFSYKNDSVNDGTGFLDFSMWTSRLFAKEAVYGENDELTDFKLNDNPKFTLDGYMYYRGNQSAYNSIDGLIGDAVFDSDPSGSYASYSRFSYDVARKPLSSDHTFQTVVDALKERRSNRTVTKIPALPAQGSFLIDGEVKKFQSGEWYYPSNSPMSGTNFSSVTASTPYVVDTSAPTNLYLRDYYYAKDFTIGSTY